MRNAMGISIPNAEGKYTSHPFHWCEYSTHQIRLIKDASHNNYQSPQNTRNGDSPFFVKEVWSVVSGQSGETRTPPFPPFLRESHSLSPHPLNSPDLPFKGDINYV